MTTSEQRHTLLELIKQGFMIFEQKKIFGNIELKKHDNE